MISLDTETTGVDLRHGARPFLVTICGEDGEPTYWEWDVCPYTREVSMPSEDCDEIMEIILGADSIVLQNGKFDVTALRAAGFDFEWPWEKTEDTLIAGHLLASNQPHDLTTMALVYLRRNIKPFEDALEAAVKEARRDARKMGWSLAGKDVDGMPSAKEKTWKFDVWLPRALAKYHGLRADHPWWTVTSDYANADSVVTLPLFQEQLKRIRARGLEAIYRERMLLPQVAFEMESGGVTISKTKMEVLRSEYRTRSEEAGKECVAIAAAKGHDLKLPKSTVNKNLRDFALGEQGLCLPPIKRSKETGEPSMDQSVLEAWEQTLPEGSPGQRFVRALRGKRKRDTALTYLAGYERFWLPAGRPGWFRLHPSLNITGTDTLRWSSSNPNEQNISKKEDFNLRRCFGPMPGREWWSMDAQNIELRIPAFEAGEKVLCDVFLHPDKPPYFGSYHLVVFDLLHPREFAKHGVKCKDLYEATLYQWVKNGNFAVIYGAQEETADRTYRVQGAYAKIRSRFPKIAALSDKWVAYADKYGYVETMPDREVSPNKGYPLLCTRSHWGGVSPTVPLNYHVQGTAMWWMAKAMTRCYRKIKEWQAEGFSARMVLQVHDELVFDFPKGADIANLDRARELRSLMSIGGEDIGVPTPVAIEYHANDWSEGVRVK